MGKKGGKIEEENEAINLLMKGSLKWVPVLVRQGEGKIW